MVSIRIVSGLVVIPEGYWNEVGKLLWELEAAETDCCKLVGNPVVIVLLMIVAKVLGGRDSARDMLTGPNAGCRVETFAMIVDVTRKNHVNRVRDRIL